MEKELNNLEATMSDKRNKYEIGRSESEMMQDALDMRDAIELKKNIPEELKNLRIGNLGVIEGETKGHKIKIEMSYGIGEKPDSFVGEIDGESLPASLAQEIYNKFFRPLTLIESEYPAAKRELDQSEEFRKKREELMNKADAIKSKVDDILK